jgi:hypothetical protein
MTQAKFFPRFQLAESPCKFQPLFSVARMVKASRVGRIESPNDPTADSPPDSANSSGFACRIRSLSGPVHTQNSRF